MRNLLTTHFKWRIRDRLYGNHTGRRTTYFFKWSLFKKCTNLISDKCFSLKTDQHSEHPVEYDKFRIFILVLVVNCIKFGQFIYLFQTRQISNIFGTSCISGGLLTISTGNRAGQNTVKRCFHTNSFLT